MTYTVTKLITQAYYKTGIVRRQLQTLTGQQLSDGLDLLNDVLAVKSADTRLIPYYSTYDFDGVIGEEKYSIPKLLSIDSMVFFINDVRYSMQPYNRRQYFSTPRVDGISSLPYSYHMERKKGGADVYVYFTPVQAYPFKIIGKFGLLEASLNEDLSLTYDRFYITYLVYALANYICEDYTITFPPESANKLRELEETLEDIAPLDLTVAKMSTLQQRTTFNYGQANLGRGWTTS